jgi:hypothetical protein
MPKASILDSLTKSHPSADEVATSGYFGTYLGGGDDVLEYVQDEEEDVGEGRAQSVAAMNASFGRALRLAAAPGEVDVDDAKDPDGTLVREEDAMGDLNTSGGTSSLIGAGHAETETDALSVDAIMAELRALHLDLESMPQLLGEEGDGEELPEGGSGTGAPMHITMTEASSVPGSPSHSVDDHAQMGSKSMNSHVEDALVGVDLGMATASNTSAHGSPGGDMLLSTDASSYLGDYCHWVAGPRLTPGGMRDFYSGLRPSRLDLPSLGGDTDAEGSLSTASAQGTARPVRVLEVVMRPDVPERDILVECFKAARVEGLLCTMRQSNHLVLEAVPASDLIQPPSSALGAATLDRGNRSSPASAARDPPTLDVAAALEVATSASPPIHGAPASAGGFRGEGAWDTVDVQVMTNCVRLNCHSLAKDSS